MASAVDRTSDFVRSVQLSRSRSNGHGHSEHSVVSINTEDVHLASPVLNTSPSAGDFRSGMVPKSNGSLSHSDVQASQKLDRVSAIRQRSQFMRAAAAIGHDLANTFGKLEQLNGLTRTQTLFDDHSSEIQHLIYVVKENMGNLNHRIAELQTLSRAQVSKLYPLNGLISVMF